MKENEPVIRLNVLDLLLLITRWYKLFIVNFILVSTIAVVVALILPKWYFATIVILPPGGGTGGLPSFLPSELKGVAMSFGLDLPSEDIYQSILSSRTLKERIIERFNLREVYEMDEDVFPEDVIDAFNIHLIIETLDDQSISITVEDQNPELSAMLANGCVDELDKIYSEITSTTASKNRKFIERRLHEVVNTITALQDSIMLFQQDSRAVSIPDQITVMLKAAAELKAEQLSNEIKLEVMHSSLGSNHPAVSQLVIENRKLEEKYNSLISGSEGGVFIGLNELPGLGRRYSVLLRQLKIQSKLLEYIYPQYENASIQEQRETANVQILDYARVPNKKYKPQRKKIVLISAFMSLLITLIFVLLMEYWRKLPQHNSTDWEKIQSIINVFRKRRS
ncbi:MAG: GNVR domain-containing protein [Candidatus Hatepunaea meridiana]|nr:GNVR domain-containing protein [Candidatus Hatepunaea meridiana]